MKVSTGKKKRENGALAPDATCIFITRGGSAHCSLLDLQLYHFFSMEILLKVPLLKVEINQQRAGAANL